MYLVLAATSALLVVAACAASSAPGLGADSFLEDSRASCLRSGTLLDCGMYKAAYLIARIASTRRSFDIGPLRLVGVQASNVTHEETFLSRASDYSPKEPEFMKLFKYGLRQLGLFLQSHGLSLPLSGLGAGGAQLVTDDGSITNTLSDDQGRSRNLHLVVPLMIMVKLMSINALLIPTLLGVAAIKKFIILTIMVLPSFLHKLKACKIVPHLVHYTPHHTHSHEFHHDDYIPYHDSHPHHIHKRIDYRSMNL